MPTEIVQKFEHMFRVSTGANGPPAPGGAPSPTDMEKVGWLYNVLTILDGKAGALLAFNGLLLAAEALMYDKMSDKIGWLHYASLVLMIITVVAALLCLFVAHVSYAFLGKIDLSVYDNRAEIDKLGTVAQKRTYLLWLGWGLSVAAVLLFIVLTFIFLLFG
jgi:hypothetical protein